MPAVRRRATGESACTSAAKRRHLPGHHSRCPETGHDPDRATAAQHPGPGGRAQCGHCHGYVEQVRRMLALTARTDEPAEIPADLLDALTTRYRQRF